jgi:type I restriction enzyme S subunit
MIEEEEIPEHWDIVTIENVVDNASIGGTPLRSEDEYWGGDIPWISSGAVSAEGKYTTPNPEEGITKQGLEESSTKLWSEGTVLVAMHGQGTLGHSAITSIDTTGNQSICGLEVNEEKITNEYLYYWLQNIREPLANKGRGATASRQNLNQSLIIETKVPVPPLDEQDRIVNAVESQLKRLERLEKSVENIGRLSEEYDQSLVLSLMSGGVENKTSIPPEHSDIPEDWDIVKIEDVAQVETGGTPKTSVDEYWDGDITWIRVSDMPEDMYVSDSEDKITETGLKEGSCSLIDEGGVVLSTRATIGEVAIANEKLATNQGFKSMIPKSELSSKYLAYYLDSITPYLESLGKGATYDEINKGQVQNIKIPLPTFEEQEDIVNKIESFDSEKLRIAVESVEDLFKEYKNSILSNAFKGQINH